MHITPSLCPQLCRSSATWIPYDDSEAQPGGNAKKVGHEPRLGLCQCTVSQSWLPRHLYPGAMRS